MLADLESPASTSHQYGTRTRHHHHQQQHSNILKPSNRARPSPEPSTSAPLKTRAKSSPSPTVEIIQPNDFPEFPPRDVVLHPEDVNSKTFIAIGRAFMSVDNRAMTIKDLAEMTAKFGLVSMNSSAAGQAITTYIRNHNQRCEEQHDQPLLLSHTLSGTSADDDLAQGLHSKSGGAHVSKSDKRLTNFRRGTAVWYLSRATGAPCPFSRANIRLCDYVIEDKPPLILSAQPATKPRRSQPEICGQKRKRPVRSCNKGLDEDGNASDASVLDDPPPPPKVKLTLRLKPLLPRNPGGPSLSITSREVISLDSDDESSSSENDLDRMSDIQDERQSCLPKYPKRAMSIPSSEPVVYGASPFLSSTDRMFCHRSPPHISIIPSPPPDSEDEYMGSDDSDFECDSEADGESSGPRSPSAPVMPPSTRVAIKEGLQDILDPWNDDVPSDFMLTVPELDNFAPVKVEDTSMLHWQSSSYEQRSDWYSPVAEAASPLSIKEEEDDLDFNLLSPSFQCQSPLESRRHSDIGIDSDTSFFSVEPGRSRAYTAGPSFHSSSSPPSSSDVSSVPPLTPTASLSFMLGSMTVCSSTASSSRTPFTEFPAINDPAVLHMPGPSSPAITATHLEGIFAYQMMLGPSHLLRRVDSDYVNLTPIVNHLGFAPTLSKEIPDVTVVSRGSQAVVGNWVPLASARSFVQEQSVPTGLLDTFLSPSLHEQFPTELQETYSGSADLRARGQFGSQFSSTLEAERNHMASSPVPHPPLSSSLILPFMSQAISISQDSPMSESEEDLFQQFCCIPEQEKEKEHALEVVIEAPVEEIAKAVAQTVQNYLDDDDDDDVLTELEDNVDEEPTRPPSPKPLRRSKRVASGSNASAPPTTRSAPTKAKRGRGRNASS